jgi:hypothetical protein
MSCSSTKAARRGALLALIGLAPLGTGCSVALVDGPPPRAARKSGFTCTSSPVWPATDIGLSVAGLGVAASGMAKDTNLAIGLGLGAVAAFSISAAIGTQRANACNRALGHPYVPHAPTAQPDMMPELPFGTAGTVRSQHAKEGPDLEDTEEQSAAAPPRHRAAPALATPPPDLVP